MKVLVVEDDERIAAALRRGLNAAGHVVDVATDGDEGLWLAQESGHDVIVLDLMLPGRDGIQVCRQLRDAADWTPILVLTARDGEADVVAALDGGADDYMTKPFSFTVLTARLRALARRAEEREPVPLAAGDLRLDPGRRGVRRGETAIELTARQFDVLEFLVRRAGRVLSKTQILAGVWEFDVTADGNLVEVYVRRLRSKIDEPFGRNAIQTLRGAGYRLDPDGG